MALEGPDTQQSPEPATVMRPEDPFLWNCGIDDSQFWELVNDGEQADEKAHIGTSPPLYLPHRHLLTPIPTTYGPPQPYTYHIGTSPPLYLPSLHPLVQC